MQPIHFRLIVPAIVVLAMAGPARATTVQIMMRNLEISPAETSAKVGDTVEWTNKDVVAHTATARNGEFDVVIPPNKVASFVLQKAGSIDYYCRFHPNMKATLEVEP
jgi:plastocyanin